MTRPDSPRPRRHDDLVARLVDDAHPVRRLWPPSRRATVWTAATTALMAAFAIRNHLPDIGQRLAEPLFATQLAGLALGAVWCAWLALRSGVPDRTPRTGELGATVGIIGLPVLLAFGLAAEAIPDRTAFVQGGMMCSRMTLTLAALPWAGALIALRRSASLSPRLAAGLAAASGLLAAATALRVACPLGDARWHLLTWHLLPVGVGALISAMLAAPWIRPWRRPPDLTSS